MLLTGRLLVMVIALALLHEAQRISLRHHACLSRPWRNRLIDLEAETFSKQDMMQTQSSEYDRCDRQSEHIAACYFAPQVAATWAAIWSVLPILCADATNMAQHLTHVTMHKQNLYMCASLTFLPGCFC